MSTPGPPACTRTRPLPRLTLPGDPPIEVALRRSAQARRLSLRVSGLDGRVTLTVPRTTPMRTVHGFLAERADWLRARRDETPMPGPPRIGDTLLFEGRATPIRPAEDGRARATTDDVAMPATPDGPERLRRALVAAARARLAPAVTRHAATLGRPHGRITLRDPRSRWGSCSSQGALMFSWRLVMAPPEVLDGVAAHEVAHLAVMDHSPAFWATLDALLPDHRARREWLTRNGATLHRVSFAPA